MQRWKGGEVGMIVKAEKIISHDNILRTIDKYDLDKIIKKELTWKIVDKMIEEKLIKFLYTNEKYPITGDIVKVIAVADINNPDDIVDAK